MKYTIYKITNLINQKIYIGKHQTLDPYDDYMGSGKLLKASIAKHGKENFKKEVLHVFDNEEDMNAMEVELVTEEFCSLDSNYNLCPGGRGGWGYINSTGLNNSGIDKRNYTEIAKKWTSHKGPVTEETKNKISEANKKTNISRGIKVSKALTGSKKSEEHKRKIAESVRKRHAEKRAGIV